MSMLRSSIDARWVLSAKLAQATIWHKPSSRAKLTASRLAQWHSSLSCCAAGEASIDRPLALLRVTTRSWEVPMRIKAAVLYETNQPYVIETVELDPPKQGE